MSVATERATQQVARIHRVRLVTHAFIAGLLAAALIGIPFGLWVRHSARSSSRQNAQYNCALIEGVTTQLTRFIENDAYLRLAQAKASLGPVLAKDLRRVFPGKDLATLAELSNRLSGQAATYWTGTIVPALNDIARANCQAHLG